jgi:hypothetical protein
MFAKAVVYEIETNFKELQWKLDYVRLNIHAKNSISKILNLLIIANF